MKTKIFANTNLRHYFFADIISQFGSGMSFIGINWYILEKTGQNSLVGIVLSLTILSGLIALPFSGVIADRFNRKSILIWSNLLRAAVILAVLILITATTVKLSVYVFLLAVTSGIGWTIFIPASKGFLQEIVSRDDLLKGNTISEISLQVGMFTSGAVAGTVYRYFGFDTILLIDALTFIISNLFLLKIRLERKVIGTQHAPFFKQLSDGWSYLYERRALFLFGIMMFIPFVATMTSNVVLPGYVSSVLKDGSVTFGIIDMCYGIGACLAGVFVLFLTRYYSRHLCNQLFFTGSLLSLSLLFFNNLVVVSFVAYFTFGLSNTSLRTIMHTTAMEIVPSTYMGRAMSIWSFFSMLMQIACMLLVGKTMDMAGAQYGIAFLSGIMGVGFLSYYLCSLFIYKTRGECI